MYKVLLKPIWTYGLQFWGMAKMFSTNRIQAFQNIALRRLSNAPPYVSNLTIHNDLSMKTEHEETRVFYKRFHNRFQIRLNSIIKDLYTLTLPENPCRRLKRS